MPDYSFYTNNTSPNAKGGAFGYDGRTGLGIGSLTKGPASGIGSNWSMGDALSSPKSEYDYEEEDLKKFIVNSKTTVRELALFAGLIDEDDYNELEADIESKSHSAFHRTATDSLAHRGTDISSLGGLGNSMAGVIGLSAGHKAEGDIVSESSLRLYIKELLLNELSTSSGRIAVMSRPKAKNTGGKRNSDPLSIDTSSASKNTSDAVNRDPIVKFKPKNPITGHIPTARNAQNDKGYGQSRFNTTDGGETVGAKKRLELYISMSKSFDDGESTGDILVNSLEQEEKDLANVEYFNNNQDN